MAEPFSRIVRIDALPKDGQTLDIEADAAERLDLAALFNLPSIEALTATLTVKRTSRGGARVTGTVHGELTQVCGVSLDPFPATINEEVDVRFAPKAEEKRDPEEAESFSIADEDEPDPLIDGKINLGALAAEFFALGIDPYPRKPGVIFEGSEETERNVSPFSELANRRAKPAD